MAAPAGGTGAEGEANEQCERR